MTRNYAMIGAGGTGSILFPALERYLRTYARESGEDYTLTVIDGKELAPEKLERQLFAGRYAGSNKAESLIAQYDADPRVIIAVPKYLDDENITGIDNGDVVLIAADNFPVRARIESRALQLDNVTIINGGNEMHDGSLQVWARRHGADITPRLSQGHPEILQDDGADPTRLSCEEIAELPGGQQTIIANMMSATAMLNALRRVHDWEMTQNTENAPFPPGEEVFFDLDTFAMRATHRPPEQAA